MDSPGTCLRAAGGLAALGWAEIGAETGLIFKELGGEGGGGKKKSALAMDTCGRK